MNFARFQFVDTTTKLLPADGAAIARAAEVLRRGGLVSFPTETVYGLGADATNDTAVAGIFAAKDRPRFNPLIVHVAGVAEAESLVVFNDMARLLARAFWPGPLTLVLPRREGTAVSLLATAGLDTIALRVPSHPVAQALLATFGRPLAAPSANPSGRISATTAQHVASELGERADLILDGGPVMMGIESTVVAFDGNTVVLLRPGATPRESIEAVAGPLAMPAKTEIRSPGQLARHYAPRSKLRLNATGVTQGEALLAFGAHVPSSAGMVRNLSERGDLTEAAANLFAMLRELDAAETGSIAVMPIPDSGLGEAINDRLRRAAVPADTRDDH